ncbi:M23 family metallopeptidase [Salinibacter altiplanensis]|uniref:M23 family metallopeptidase n=1 Tax=Salinibacter altiplanensis TaxID=1803181 RepID=UPI000C9FBD6A|nr:M23 family metallopeptidase [Salinibacter altiplanensis]
MWSFFADLIQNVGTDHTIVVMDADGMGKTRRYQVRPSRMMMTWGGSLLGVGATVAVLIAFTPLRTQVPGYGTEEMQENARLNTLRVQALQDSLSAQRHYIQRLRGLITGRVDSTPLSEEGRPESRGARGARSPNEEGGAPGGEATESSARNAHRQPAFAPTVGVEGNAPAALTGLSFPLSPPVTNGFPTRGFDVESGHYGVDVAVSEGEYIRAVGEGYVVWADWAQDGGYTIAVQHAGGYLSVYKHSRRLLKQLGDRVTTQEPLAVTGNTGAVTTGPHLHFELWRNGLAQGPDAYIAGW